MQRPSFFASLVVGWDRIRFLTLDALGGDGTQVPVYFSGDGIVG